jgi:hypothetical protein
MISEPNLLRTNTHDVKWAVKMGLPSYLILCFSPNEERPELFNTVICLWRACSTNGGEEEEVGNPEGMRPLGRPRRRWVDNIKMYLIKIGWDGMVWIGSI